jgi:cytochrome P450
MPILGLIKPLIGGKFMEKYGGKMAAENVRLIGYCSKLMDERVAKEEGNKAANPDEIRKDFTHYLLESRDPQTGKGYSQTELQSEAALIVVAGADTTSVTLSATIFYLVHYPQVLAKLATEIRTAFSDVEEIRVGQTLGSLVYLRAVIDEALRISPPIPGLLPREVLPGGIEIDGNLIPSGTQVGASAYAIHHNEEYFPNAFTYWPERWIVDPETGVSEEDVAQAHSAFCAFSLGTRGCIGKGLAYAELTVTLGRLLFLFDLREAEGETIGGGKPELGFGRKRKNEYQIKDRFVGERDGPVIEFKARVVST